MKPFHFNIRANGIFADGFVDRDGAPLRDTFVHQLRAKLIGAASRNWPKSQTAELAATFSSAEMNAIMVPADHPHVKVEYDTSYYGGAYAGQGHSVYVPEALIDLLDGDVGAAFAKLARIDAIHMVGHLGDERFDADGEPLEEFALAAERCA